MKATEVYTTETHTPWRPQIRNKGLSDEPRIKGLKMIDVAGSRKGIVLALLFGGKSEWQSPLS